MFLIEEEITISELDEALAFLVEKLKIDQAGNRMNWRKKELLLSSVDDLLDARLELLSKNVSPNR